MLPRGSVQQIAGFPCERETVERYRAAQTGASPVPAGSVEIVNQNIDLCYTPFPRYR